MDIHLKNLIIFKRYIPSVLLGINIVILETNTVIFTAKPRAALQTQFFTEKLINSVTLFFFWLYGATTSKRLETALQNIKTDYEAHVKDIQNPKGHWNCIIGSKVRWFC